MATPQKDASKVVGSSAYLLFYRRRSDIPLGGPRFQEIFDRYERQTTTDDDMQDSGEGQRLGQGSSLRGSPSALTGAGVTLPQGNRGLGRIQPDLDSGESEPPLYQASTTNAIDAEDDTEMGMPPWSQTGTLHNSIEADGEDEGIGLPDFSNAGPGMASVLNASGWSFNGLSEIGGGDDDMGSDVAQGDTSSMEEDDAVHIHTDGDPSQILDLDEPGSDYVHPPEPQPPYSDYEIPPAPTLQEQAYMGQIAEQAWDKQVHTVPANLDDDQVSDKVAEIHVGDEPPLPEEPRPSQNA